MAAVKDSGQELAELKDVGEAFMRIVSDQSVNGTPRMRSPQYPSAALADTLPILVQVEL